MLIDAQTRDIVQDMYIRKVEKVDGELYNVEFDAIKAMKDPASRIPRAPDGGSGPPPAAGEAGCGGAMGRCTQPC